MTDFRRIVSEHRRVVWILTAALIVNAALYVLVVYPLAQRVHTEEQQAGDATRDLNAARRAFNAARGTVTGKKEADDELQKFYRDVLAADYSTARRTLYPYVEQLARKMSLTTAGGRFEDQLDRKGGLNKLTMTMTLAGEYANIRRFIHELETASQFIVLERVVVTQGGDGERDLDVTAHVSTYYRTAVNGN
jgi:Tfp pilus assembly protein PilO